ncbi:DUF6634 family protein [Methylobacterium brachiatum]|jgi:hypothetical protein|uniref:DUF6634 family protein n=1 Tax=Methylobacterium brachiatum TaxID=269660 RepID=UPI00244CEF26|nr:DUF6634 family protein [Methylobacterium brachiatum]MDH2312339.1 hypothetical protein [Methylobacterium brachiatum]
MSILNRGAGPFPELAHRARRYRSLADDLECIARGEHPTDVDLQSAPHLSGWRVYLLPLPYLLGTVVGHLLIEDGQICRTSELVTFDLIAGYARTYSRFYRFEPRHA